MFFSRNPLSSQMRQSPAITFQGCVSSSPRLVTGGLWRGCDLLGADTHISLLPENKPEPAPQRCRRMCPAAVAGPLLPSPLQPPLLGRRGPKSKNTKNQGREGAGRQASQVLSDSEVAPWERVRTAALSRFSPLPVPQTQTWPQTSIPIRATLRSHKNREDSKEETFQSSFVSGIKCVPKYAQLKNPLLTQRLDLKNIIP